MEYYEMTTDNAIQFLQDHPDKIVLIAVKDLEDDSNVAFTSMPKNDCESMIKEAETIAAFCDDLAEQLRLFSRKQNILNIVPKGTQRTILFRKEYGKK